MDSGADQNDSVREWLSLPRCVYLDTPTLQHLHNFGGEIFEGDRFEPAGRSARVQGLAAEIEALHMIFMINQRAAFEFVVTEASLRGVIDRGRTSYTQWVYDVLDTWLVQSEGEEPPTPGHALEDRRFGMISAKDRRLLQETLDWRCDAFMTMERRLPTTAAYIAQETGLQILRPTA